MKIKQVILIRKDLKMRRGKEIAQGSHASMEFLVSRLRSAEQAGVVNLELESSEISWLREGTRKICLQVSSEQQLLDIHEKALGHGLKSHLIRDSGKTEFGGIPTLTACAIGPDSSDEIDAVTGDLGLY